MAVAAFLGEWLPEDHLAYFVLDVVNALGLTPIVKVDGGGTCGNAPDDLRLLVTILLYVYAVSIPASRQITRELEEKVPVRVPAAT